MRANGKAIDPRAMLFDMSSDPVAYGVARCELVKQATGKLLADYPTQGKSWQELTNAYISLTSESSNALTAISRYIGGVYVERAYVGQVKDNPPSPFRPVELEKQKAAMRPWPNTASVRRLGSRRSSSSPTFSSSVVGLTSVTTGRIPNCMSAPSRSSVPCWTSSCTRTLSTASWTARFMGIVMSSVP
nr:zinc-dependent metalloprotease [Verrucomicrobium spinosum]